MSSAQFSWASYTELGYSSSLGRGYRLSDGRLILALGLALVVVAAAAWSRSERLEPVLAALGLGVVALGDTIASWRAIIRIPAPLLLASFTPDAGLVMAISGAVLATVGGCLLLWMTMPLRQPGVLGGPAPSRVPSH
jgi:hypothetical protein